MNKEDSWKIYEYIKEKVAELAKVTARINPDTESTRINQKPRGGGHYWLFLQPKIHKIP